MPEPFDNLVLDIIGGLIVAAMLAGLGWLWRHGSGSPTAPAPPQPGTNNSVTVRAADRVVTLQNVQVGGDLNIYVDDLPQAKPEVRGHFQEGHRLSREERHEAAVLEFEKAFAAAENDSQRCALHILIGNSYCKLGRAPEAEGHYRHALDAAARAGDQKGRANALGNLGIVHESRRESDKAEEYHRSALAVFQEIGDPVGQAQALCNLGFVYTDRGEFDRAEEHSKRALALFEGMGNLVGQAHALSGLGLIYLRRGELGKAEEFFKRALDIAEGMGEKLGQAILLSNLALVAERRAEPGKARYLLAGAKALYEALGTEGEGPENVRRALERLGPP